MKAVNIKWDTDGDMELLEELPIEVEIPDYLITDDEDDLLDNISDWLSDEYGFCHDGFELVNQQIEARFNDRKRGNNYV